MFFLLLFSHIINRKNLENKIDEKEKLDNDVSYNINK